MTIAPLRASRIETRLNRNNMLARLLFLTVSLLLTGSFENVQAVELDLPWKLAYLDYVSVGANSKYLEWHSGRLNVYDPDTGLGLGTTLVGGYHKKDWKLTGTMTSYDTEQASGTPFLLDLFPIAVNFMPYTFKTALGTGGINFYYSFSRWTSVAGLPGGGSDWFKTEHDEYGAQIVFPYVVLKAGVYRVKIPTTNTNDDNSNFIKYRYNPMTDKGGFLGAELYFGSIVGKSNCLHNALKPLNDALERRRHRKAAELQRQRALQMERPAQLTVSNVKFSGDVYADKITNNDKGLISFTISNDARAGLAADLKIRISPEANAGGLRFDKEKMIGDLPPGKTTKVEYDIASTDPLGDGMARLRLDFMEANRNPPAPLVVEIPTVLLKKPELSVQNIIIDDGQYRDRLRIAFGNGNGIAEPGEAVEVYVTVMNTGGTPYKDAVTSIVSGNADLRLLEKGDFQLEHRLGDLQPGELKRVAFGLSVARLYSANDSLPLVLRLRDARPRFNSEIPLGLKLNVAPVVSHIVRFGGASLPSQTGIFKTDDIDTPPTIRARASENDIAVVVAVEAYRNSGIPRAEHAANDGKVLSDYLINTMGFPRSNVILLRNEDASRADLEKYLGSWLKNRATARSRVFIYFSGHGGASIKDGEAYFVPYDGDPEYLDETAYPLNRVAAMMENLPGKLKVIMVDSCFSGQGKRSIVAKGSRPLVHVQSIPPSKNFIYISASGPQQISLSATNSSHGLLTYFFLKAVRDAARGKGERNITLREVARYVLAEVPASARVRNTEQIPQISGPDEQLDEKLIPR